MKTRYVPPIKDLSGRRFGRLIVLPKHTFTKHLKAGKTIGDMICV